MVMAYTVGCAVMLAAFKASPNVAALQWLLVAGVGFMLYGPQMLVGLCGAETVARPAVSACQGFLGWISYLGNPPLGSPVRQEEWGSRSLGKRVRGSRRSISGDKGIRYKRREGGLVEPSCGSVLSAHARLGMTWEHMLA